MYLIFTPKYVVRVQDYDFVLKTNVSCGIQTYYCRLTTMEILHSHMKFNLLTIENLNYIIIYAQNLKLGKQKLALKRS